LHEDTPRAVRNQGRRFKRVPSLSAVCLGEYFRRVRFALTCRTVPSLQIYARRPEIVNPGEKKLWIYFREAVWLTNVASMGVGRGECGFPDPTQEHQTSRMR
jgi:hypothetical protein